MWLRTRAMFCLFLLLGASVFADGFDGIYVGRVDSTSPDIEMPGSRMAFFANNTFVWDLLGPWQELLDEDGIWVRFSAISIPGTYTYSAQKGEVSVQANWTGKMESENLAGLYLIAIRVRPGSSPLKRSNDGRTITGQIRIQADFLFQGKKDTGDTTVFSVAMQLGAPDVGIESAWWWPESPPASEELVIGFAVRNWGNMECGVCSYCVYLDNIERACGDIPSLPGNGGSVTIQDVNLGRLRWGEHEILIIADSENLIDESNESNNSLLRTILIEKVNGASCRWMLYD